MRCLLHILNEFVIGYICSSHFTQTEMDTCIRPVSDTGVVMLCPPSPRRRRAGAGAGTVVVVRRRRWQGGGGRVVAFAMRVASTLTSCWRGRAVIVVVVVSLWHSPRALRCRRCHHVAPTSSSSSSRRGIRHGRCVVLVVLASSSSSLPPRRGIGYARRSSFIVASWPCRRRRRVGVMVGSLHLWWPCR